MPLVSVVMPVYNGEKYLAEAIESILAQTLSDFEFLIVDDGSQDASSEIIQSYALRDSRIRFFQLDHNCGIGAALNVGWASAKGDFIARMDSDDISVTNRLAQQIDFFHFNPAVGAAGTWCRMVNHDMSKTILEVQTPQEHAIIALNVFFAPSIFDPTIMYRRERVLAARSCLTAPKYIYDGELQIRLISDSGIIFANVPEILYIYRKHGNSKTSASAASDYEPERNFKRRALEHIWGEAPPATLDRLHQLRFGGKLSWAQRRATKRDLLRLIDSVIDAQWVEPEDRPLLISAVNGRLEQASPRLWQQFCHWRRHHFQ